MSRAAAPGNWHFAACHHDQVSTVREPPMVYRTTLPLLLTLLGCARDNSPVTSPSPASQQSIVVVVGDATAADVAAQLRKAEVRVTDDRSLIGSASLVVIAQDATVGPLPVHREVAAEIARTGHRRVLWIQTKSSAIDDQELLELEELEARELLNEYKLPGDTIQFAVDAESAPVDSRAPSLKGWTAIIRFVSSCLGNG